ncbi:hypothetical protein QQZ08_012281 [Neonectria magnoliae]|uniref:Uncharacterized protein n=1 Tax=Neonectria magnoliae TaxID=2732573 RepID=A0ABR1H3N0_9HYPO
MQVLALGMSRTGTSSMLRALMILGCNDVYHGFALFANICETQYWMEAFNQHVFRATDEQGLQANARDGYQTVRATTPPERLLRYNLKDGWEPLCKFLGKPVPDVPFPRINDKESFHEKLTIIMQRGAKVLARRVSYVAVPGLIATAAYFLVKDGSAGGLLSSSSLAGLRMANILTS